MNKLTQQFYKYITTPIARCLDFINIPKRIKLERRRSKLALKNMNDFIDETTKILLEEELQSKLNEGKIPRPEAISYIIGRNLCKAICIYEEKKANGYFDELNIMIK